jgi:hypothetical protein
VNTLSKLVLGAVAGSRSFALLIGAASAAALVTGAAGFILAWRFV